MLNCSQFTIHRFAVNVNTLNKPINLYVFGDVHRFAKGCAEEKWLEFLDIAKKDTNALFLGMGDYDDLASQSERVILINPGLHDDTRWSVDDVYDYRVKQFQEEIKFMKYGLIGLLEGNHYGVYSTGGMTTTQKLCENLRCRYLGVNAFIRLSFICGSKRNAIDIFAHHGKGAARLIGSDLNTVEQMVANAEADIYLMGHSHQRNAGKVNRLHLQHGGDGLILKDKTMLLARTGSFLRGYMPDHQSYVVKGAMKPSDIGYLKIILTPTREARLNNKTRKTEDHLTIKIEATI